jgi:hypothetical protein
MVSKPIIIRINADDSQAMLLEGDRRLIVSFPGERDDCVPDPSVDLTAGSERMAVAFALRSGEWGLLPRADEIAATGYSDVRAGATWCSLR